MLGITLIMFFMYNKYLCFFVFLLFSNTSCDDYCENDGCDCVDSSKADPNAVCIEVFDPVCGCDGVTYSNVCFAQAAGVLRWETEGCN